MSIKDFFAGIFFIGVAGYFTFELVSDMSLKFTKDLVSLLSLKCVLWGKME